MLRNQPAPEKGLNERVEEQLAMLDFETESLEWVRFLVDCLDENGYLSATDEMLLELAEESGLAGERGALASAISNLQRLEPRGAGFRSSPVKGTVLQAVHWD